MLITERRTSWPILFRSSVIFSLALCGLFVGCQRDGLLTAPVSGIVTLNGKPLVDARVVFQPAASGNSGPPSAGETDDLGEFTLTFVDNKPGAVVGKHRVMISTRKMAASSENEDLETEVFKELVPEVYRKDPITMDVRPEGLLNVRIELTGSPPATNKSGR